MSGEPSEGELYLKEKMEEMLMSLYLVLVECVVSCSAPLPPFPQMNEGLRSLTLLELTLDKCHPEVSHRFRWNLLAVLNQGL